MRAHVWAMPEGRSEGVLDFGAPERLVREEATACSPTRRPAARRRRPPGSGCGAGRCPRGRRRSSARSTGRPSALPTAPSRPTARAGSMPRPRRVYARTLPLAAGAADRVLGSQSHGNRRNRSRSRPGERTADERRHGRAAARGHPAPLDARRRGKGPCGERPEADDGRPPRDARQVRPLAGRQRDDGQPGAGLEARRLARGTATRAAAHRSLVPLGMDDAPVRQLARGLHGGRQPTSHSGRCGCRTRPSSTATRTTPGRWPSALTANGWRPRGRVDCCASGRSHPTPRNRPCHSAFPWPTSGWGLPLIPQGVISSRSETGAGPVSFP